MTGIPINSSTCKICILVVMTYKDSNLASSVNLDSILCFPHSSVLTIMYTASV